jgi:hypothetical protein
VARSLVVLAERSDQRRLLTDEALAVLDRAMREDRGREGGELLRLEVQEDTPPVDDRVQAVRDCLDILHRVQFRKQQRVLQVFISDVWSERGEFRPADLLQSLGRHVPISERFVDRNQIIRLSPTQLRNGRHSLEVFRTYFSCFVE